MSSIGIARLPRFRSVKSRTSSEPKLWALWSDLGLVFLPVINFVSPTQFDEGEG